VEDGKGQFAGSEIKGKTLGIIGLGYIGVNVANAAEMLGMNVIGYDPFIHVKAAHELSHNIPMAKDLGEMLPKCDYISIHAPAMASTEGMIDQKRFSQMKKGVCFLNFSRANLVNEQDLFDAIEAGIVKKYITDFPNDNLLGKQGVICLPHLGASTAEAEELCAVMAADEMIDYLENGNIKNSVNYPTISLGHFDSTFAECRVCILNRNIPSMLQKITTSLANVNISDMVNKSKGEFACTMLDIDSMVDSEDLKKKLEFEGIIAVRIIKNDPASSEKPYETVPLPYMI
jgi:D-3-phosphoglycerate dehydrogenase